MGIAMRVRARSNHGGLLRGGRFRRQRTPEQGVYRALTLGTGHEDWVVLDPHGEVVFRGYAVYAARLATQLTNGIVSG
jgi:hypothetical protein